MEQLPTNDQRKDEALWAIAKKRAGFKNSLFAYVVINLFLWAIWYFTKQRPDFGDLSDFNPIPWPAWVSLGWGIGIAFQYADAYLFNKNNSVENEYQKLKNKSLEN